MTHHTRLAGELLYYVTPHVAGESLRELLARRGPLPPAEAVDLALQVSEALDYAHRQGIVHRDIKPDNILIADGQAIVADFGVARAVRRDDETVLTEEGAIVGTAAYLSPEQVAGQPPFRERPDRTILAQHLYDTPPPLTGFRADVPPGLERAVSVALAKRPGDRFDSAAELGAELRAAIRGGVPRGAPVGSGLRIAGIALVVAAGLLLVLRCP